MVPMTDTGIDPTTHTATRRALHGIAELVLAGPQYAASGTIRLRVVPGGIATVHPGPQVESGELVWDGGRMPLAGTARELAAAAGLEAQRAPIYEDSSGVDPDEELSLDPGAVAAILGWFARGDEALRAFAPDTEPVLWPEHFDLGISAEEVNYGVSPGDSAHEGAYAYVGPWTPRTGDFWKASFGALRPASDLADAAAVRAFFDEGRAAAAGA
jgi:hypothetical protein